jgi:predicted porin
MIRLSRPVLAAVALSAAPCLVHAQSNVTVYGLIDTAIRYSTHEGADGSGKAQLSDGVLTGSRLGFRGAEALGGGYKAEFVLETGYSPASTSRAAACSAGNRPWACRAASAA